MTMILDNNPGVVYPTSMLDKCVSVRFLSNSSFYGAGELITEQLLKEAFY